MIAAARNKAVGFIDFKSAKWDVSKKLGVGSRIILVAFVTQYSTNFNV
jgi:hypothetical protein